MARLRLSTRLRLRADAVLGAAGGGLAVLIGGVVGVMQDEPRAAIGVSVAGAAAVSWAIYRQVRSAPGSRPVAAAPPVGPGNATVWNIPPPVEGFTGRQDDFAALDRAFSSPGLVHLVAVAGLGGMGKTQLALRYAAMRAERADVSVGWFLNASSREYLLDGLTRLGATLGLPESGNGEAYAAGVVMEIGRRRAWLLVYDDAKDQATIAGLVPLSGPGQVIITSRFADWRGAVTTLRAEPLDDETGADFLQARTGEGDRPAALTLAKRLGGLPLALEQAAAYCRDSGIGLVDYLGRFAATPISLLGAGQPPDQEPVARTWRVNLAAARHRDRATIELLSFLAFVAPVALPREVLATFSAALPRRLRRVVRDELAFDRVISILRHLSLLVVQPDGFYSHALVQDVMRAEIGRPERRFASRWSRPRWIETVLSTLAEQFPADERAVDRWDWCAVLRPHAEAVLSLSVHLDPPPMATSLLAHRLAHYVRDRGEYAAARDLLHRAVVTAERQLGRTDYRTQEVLGCLAITRHELGEFGGAREIYEELLRGVVTIDDGEVRIPIVSAGDELYQLGIMNNLANTLYAQGELSVAREVNLHVFARRQQLLGQDHLWTLTSMNGLGLVLAGLGDLDDARSLHEYVLANRRSTLGDAHPETLDAIDSLAQDLRTLGDIDGALALHEEELASRRAVQGDDHPRTLIAAQNLAELRSRPATAIRARGEAPADAGQAQLAPTTAINLAEALAERDHVTAARSLLQRIIDDGRPGHAPMAAVILGNILADKGCRIRVGHLRFRDDFTWVPAIELGIGLELQGDTVAARAFWQLAIDSHHPDYAPMAAINLGYTHYPIAVLSQPGGVIVPLHHPRWTENRLGVGVKQVREVAKARAAWHLAVDSAHTDHAPEAACLLGQMHATEGDLEAARAAYRLAIDSGHPAYREEAEIGLTQCG
jgi:tetratricopeptide (TPR) repeat protein